LASLLGLALLPIPAFAQITVGLSATGQYEYNSNVFDLQPGFTFLGLGPNPHLGDSDYTYSGAINIKGKWRQQTVYADANGDQVDYDYYTRLNHNAYKLDAGWKGTFGSVVDGNLEVSRIRSMVPFDYVFQSALSLSTEQREQGGFGLQFLPRWRFEVSGYTHTVTWPLPTDPNLAVDESEGELALKYVGTAGLTSGLSAGYLSGHYTGSINPALNPSYRQWSGNYVANYMSGRSTLVSAIGYTQRTSPGAASLLNSISAVTGNLNYSNQLTGKTSIGVILARMINTYITNSGSEIDNSATLTANWQATYKTGATISYIWDYAQLPGQGNRPFGSDRLDHIQTASAAVHYQALRWLALRPFVNYQTRSSNYVGGNFDAWVVGISLTLQWQSM
jgi:hypothetical protein